MLRPARVLLVHGGFFPETDAAAFWGRTGVTEGLRAAGLDVVAPDRAAQPCTWRQEADHLADAAPATEPAVAVAGSNGCSAAVRLALDHPALVLGLVLCWPATCGDARADALGRRRLLELGWEDEQIAELQQGDTLRGVGDHELRQLGIAVVVVPSESFNVTHQAATVDRLLALLPHARSAAACPEAPAPAFPTVRSLFLATVSAAVDEMATRRPSAAG